MPARPDPPDDLVGDGEHRPTTQHQLDCREVSGKRDDYPVSGQDELGEEGGDVAGDRSHDRVLELSGAAGDEGEPVLALDGLVAEAQGVRRRTTMSC